MHPLHYNKGRPKGFGSIKKGRLQMKKTFTQTVTIEEEIIHNVSSRSSWLEPNDSKEFDFNVEVQLELTEDGVSVVVNEMDFSHDFEDDAEDSHSLQEAEDWVERIAEEEPDKFLTEDDLTPSY